MFLPVCPMYTLFHDCLFRNKKNEFYLEIWKMPKFRIYLLFQLILILKIGIVYKTLIILHCMSLLMWF